MQREPDISEFISNADMNVAVEIGEVIKRGATSKERVAATLAVYAFALVEGDDRAAIFLLQEILRLNRNLKSERQLV